MPPTGISAYAGLKGIRRIGAIKRVEQTVNAAPVCGARRYVNVLALIDPTRDKVSGDWSFNRGTLLNPGGSNDRLRLPYKPGLEYDFFVDLIAGENGAIQLLSVNHQCVKWIAGLNREKFAFDFIDGKDGSANGTLVVDATLAPPGKRYTSLVRRPP